MLHRFGLWVENASRQLHDQFDKWDAEYEHFTETEPMREDLADIFHRIDGEFSQHYAELRDRLRGELDAYRFLHPELEQRVSQVRESLDSLR